MWFLNSLLPKREEQKQSWLPPHKMVLLCLPLRTAVFLAGIGTIFVSLFLLKFRAFIEEERRTFVGGYSDDARVVIDILETTGFLWGAAGAFGALYLRPGPVQVFLIFQAVRLLVWLWTFLKDVPMLMNCQLGRDDPAEFAKQYGANQAMLTMAGNGTCLTEGAVFLTISPLSLLFYFQFVVASMNLLSDMEEEPRYLMNLPKDPPNGAFYTKSMATRSGAAERFAENGIPLPPELAGSFFGSSTPMMGQSSMPFSPASMASFGPSQLGPMGMPMGSFGPAPGPFGSVSPIPLNSMVGQM